MNPWQKGWTRKASPGARQCSRLHRVVSLLLLALFVPFAAAAAEETRPMRAVVGASVSQGTALGSPWAPRTSYSVSLLGLGQAGQGLGARLTVLPPATGSGTWELSTDAVARFTGEGPLYFKALGGAAFTPRSGEPVRLRAGGEFGVHAIRGSIGLELGVAGVYAFPPSRFAQGQGVVSLGVGLLFGFDAPSRAPALAPSSRQWAQQAVLSPSSAAALSAEGASSWQGAPGSFAERDVIQQILLLRKPLDVALWWGSGPGEQDMPQWTHPLSPWERQYVEAMSAQTVPAPLRMRPPVTAEQLTAAQREDLQKRLGSGTAAAEGYAHWENRRRIIKHYTVTHPVTLRILLRLQGVTRDINPLHFALERGWQMASGQEMFTGQQVSQLGAAQEFFTALAVGVATGKLMTATRPVPGWGVSEPVQPVGPRRVETPPAPPRAVEPAPEPAPAPVPPAPPRAVAPAPGPAPTPAPPPPAPGPLAPSPELVQALTSKNPTPQVPAGPRLRQDVTVKPKVPDPLPLERPISPSSSQNAQLQADLEFLDEVGATNVRVNQQQLTLKNGQRVGINRPDLQFDYGDCRYSVEYDSPISGRGPSHQSRLSANDPQCEVILIIVPK